jgi:phosphoglycolate phosphatase
MDLFFDLDGTLVDSLDGILASLGGALEKCAIQPRVHLDRTLIGPPLRQTLQKVAGAEDTVLLDQLVRAFKDHYDSAGCLLTEPFPGVTPMLEGWADAGHRLFIVTNKRQAPTLTILKHLGWKNLFTGIHGIDATTPPCASKADLVTTVINLHQAQPREGVLVGDSEDDGHAAQVNGLPFVFADYGYGTLEDRSIPVAVRIQSLAGLDLARLRSRLR